MQDEVQILEIAMPAVRSRKELFEIMALPSMAIGVIAGQEGYWVKLDGVPFRRIATSMIDALVEDGYLFWNGAGYELPPRELDDVRDALGYTQLLMPLMTLVPGKAV